MNQELRDTAKRVWESLPLKERSIRKVVAECKRLGHPVSVSTMQRWSKVWVTGGEFPSRPVPPKPVEHRVEIIDHGERIVPERTSSGQVVAEIPEVLRQALDPRLDPLIQFETVQRAEKAILEVFEEIASRKSQIADNIAAADAESETTERTDGKETITKLRKGQTGRDAVVALVQLTSGLNTLSNIKARYTIGYRDLSQGDALRGEGRKAEAKAQAIIEGGRPDRAKTIDGTASASDQQDALAALRDRATGK